MEETVSDYKQFNTLRLNRKDGPEKDHVMVDDDSELDTSGNLIIDEDADDSDTEKNVFISKNGTGKNQPCGLEKDERMVVGETDGKAGFNEVMISGDGQDKVAAGDEENDEKVKAERRDQEQEIANKDGSQLDLHNLNHLTVSVKASESKGSITLLEHLGITINTMENVRPGGPIAVRVHLISGETGEYFQYQNGAPISPLTTGSFYSRKRNKGSYQAVWQKCFLINESFSYIANEEHQAIVFFEVIHMIAGPVNKYTATRDRQRIAWTSCHIAKAVGNAKLTLQLYRPLTEKHTSAEEMFTWHKLPRTRYISTLKVSIAKCTYLSLDGKQPLKFDQSCLQKKENDAEMALPSPSDCMKSDVVRSDEGRSTVEKKLHGKETTLVSAANLGTSSPLNQAERKTDFLQKNGVGLPSKTSLSANQKDTISLASTTFENASPLTLGQIKQDQAPTKAQSIDEVLVPSGVGGPPVLLPETPRRSLSTSEIAGHTPGELEEMKGPPILSLEDSRYNVSSENGDGIDANIPKDNEEGPPDLVPEVPLGSLPSVHSVLGVSCNTQNEIQKETLVSENSVTPQKIEGLSTTRKVSLSVTSTPSIETNGDSHRVLPKGTQRVLLVETPGLLGLSSIGAQTTTAQAQFQTVLVSNPTKNAPLVSNEHDFHGEAPKSMGSVGAYLFNIGLDLVKEKAYKGRVRALTRKFRERTLGDRGKLTLEHLVEECSDLLKKNSLFHFKSVKCKKCKFNTDSLITLEKHKERPHRDGTSIQCMFCKFSTKDLQIFSHHMKAVHRKGTESMLKCLPHQCPLCPFENSHAFRVVQHLQACSKKFDKTRNLAPAVSSLLHRTLSVEVAKLQKLTSQQIKLLNSKKQQQQPAGKRAAFCNTLPLNQPFANLPSIAPKAAAVNRNIQATTKPKGTTMPLTIQQSTASIQNPADALYVNNLGLINTVAPPVQQLSSGGIRPTILQLAPGSMNVLNPMYGAGPRQLLSFPTKSGTVNLVVSGPPSVRQILANTGTKPRTIQVAPLVNLVNTAAQPINQSSSTNTAQATQTSGIQLMSGISFVNTVAPPPIQQQQVVTNDIINSPTHVVNPSVNQQVVTNEFNPATYLVTPSIKQEIGTIGAFQSPTCMVTPSAQQLVTSNEALLKSSTPSIKQEGIPTLSVPSAVKPLVSAVSSPPVTAQSIPGAVKPLVSAVSSPPVTTQSMPGGVNSLVSSVSNSPVTTNSMPGALNTQVSAVFSSPVTAQSTPGAVKPLVSAVSSPAVTAQPMPGAVKPLVSAVSSPPVTAQPMPGAVKPLVSAVSSPPVTTQPMPQQSAMQIHKINDHLYAKAGSSLGLSQIPVLIVTPADSSNPATGDQTAGGATVSRYLLKGFVAGQGGNLQSGGTQDLKRPPSTPLGGPPKKRAKLPIEYQQCELCNDLLPGLEALVTHFTLKHGRHSSEHLTNIKRGKPQVRCAVCEARFYTMWGLDKHVAVHADNKCYLCRKSFKDLVFHVSSEHHIHFQDLVKKCLCVCCGKKYSSGPNHLEMHMRRCHGLDLEDMKKQAEKMMHNTSSVVPAQGCAFCGIDRFPSIQEYYNHFGTYHGGIGCRHCLVKFKSLGALANHLYEEHGEKLFMCHRCGFKCVSEDDLHQHHESLHGVKTKDPMPVGKSAIPNGDKNLVPVTKQETSGGKNIVSIYGKNYVSTRSKHQVSYDGKKPVSNDDRKSVPNVGRKPEPGGDRNLVPIAGKRPVPNRSWNSVPGGIARFSHLRLLPLHQRKCIVLVRKLTEREIAKYVKHWP